MPEGLSPSEVGKEISEHRAHVQEQEKEQGSAVEAKGRDRVMTIIEAVLLGGGGHPSPPERRSWPSAELSWRSLSSC